METLKSGLAYPTLPRRVFAAAIDDGVVALTIFAVLLLIGPLEPSPWVLVACALAALIVEPVLVSQTGASIGHRAFGLRVVDAGGRGVISFPRAALRMFLRIVLGLPSLFMIRATRRYQAIHDFAANSVVTVGNPATFPREQILRERPFVDDGYVYPRPWRRVFVILAYTVVLYIVDALLSALIVGEGCSAGEDCMLPKLLWLAALLVIYLILQGVVMVYGWSGRLWGARRVRSA